MEAVYNAETAAAEMLQTITPIELALILQQRNELGADLKTIKDIIYQLLSKVGFITEEGDIRETIDMKMILKIAAKATTGNKEFKNSMSFLAEALPLIEKYKDL